MAICPLGDSPPATSCSPLASISGPNSAHPALEAEVLVERTVPWHLIEGRQGYCRSSAERAQLLTCSISAFPTPCPWCRDGRRRGRCGGVVKDTYEYVAHYLVVNHSYQGAF